MAKVEKNNNDTSKMQIELLHQISCAFSTRKNINELIDLVLNLIHKQFDASYLSISLRKSEFTFSDFNLSGINHLDQKIQRDLNDLRINVSKTSKSQVLEAITNKTDNSISLVCIPIAYIEYVIGTLNIVIENFDEADLEFFEIIANIIAESLARLYHKNKEKSKLLDENIKLKFQLSSEYHRPPSIIGNSGAMRQVYEFISKYTTTSDTLFIRGKSGTGKELVAKEIARNYYNANFKVVNCAALPDFTLVGELFGFEKGAFARANYSWKGLLEEYPNSTIFLDEIAEVSLPAQKILANFLKTKKFYRLNGKDKLYADVRLICASSVDVESLLAKELFDEDLYAQLNKVCITLPALLDRRSDIILLAEHYLEVFSKQYNKQINRISTPAINMLTVYSWPGNVRELKNCVESAVISSRDSTIYSHNLPISLRTSYMKRHLPYGEDIEFESIIESFERELITEALKNNKGKAAVAARALNLSERIINYKIKKYAINTSWFKTNKQ